MKKQIKVFIVEDMAISRKSLETMLTNRDYNIVGSVAKAETAWEEMKNIDVDLALLDINLAGEKNGIWLAQKIRKHLNFPFIYLTAYGDQQTLAEVIDTKPNGYLRKPYQEPNLIATIEIALSSFEKQQENKNDDFLSVQTPNYLFIKDRNSKVKLFFNSILYVKSDGNYIEINLEDKKFVVRNKLVDFLDKLPKDLFYQTHQRYLVNIDEVTLLRKDVLKINEIEIPISQKYKKPLEKVFSS